MISRYVSRGTRKQAPDTFHVEHRRFEQTRFTWNIQGRDAIVSRETMMYMTAHVPRGTIEKNQVSNNIIR